MVKTITKVKTEEQYQCGECGMRYAEKEWAEKCEAWCKEHGNCNLEITSHAVPHNETSSENEVKKIEDTRSKTRLFYGSIGVAAALGFLLILYWSLRTNSSIASLISNTYDKPLYFWPYVVLTFAAIILFGVNASFFVYRWRKFGFALRSFNKGGAASGGGSLVGIAASACPVCGSALLSAIGIAGGLAAFPLGGLELKALSVGLLALPIWLTRRDMKKIECLPADSASVATSAKEAASAQAGGDGTCPIPRDASYKDEKDQNWLLGIYAVVVLFALVGWSMLKSDPAMAKLTSAKNSGGIANLQDNQLNDANVSKTGYAVYDEVVAKVLPEKGFQSRLVLGDSVIKLVKNGVIDKDKFEAIYKDRGGLPDELKDVLTIPSNKPILLTRSNANFYVNLLWPLGLANRMETNKQSPVNGKSLFNFASTGGWNLGKEENGGAYFNKLDIVGLTPTQEALATKIAQNSYRPCCNNSTFFQDCNHGSALLGVLELGAAQGLTEDELYREALAFNSFWFSSSYIQNALYLKAVKNIDWENADPKAVLDKEFSSASGNYKIQAEVAKIPNLIPTQGHGGGGGCGT